MRQIPTEPMGSIPRPLYSVEPVAAKVRVVRSLDARYEPMNRETTHSECATLPPSLFELMAGSFWVAIAGDNDRVRVIKMIRAPKKSDQRICVGVINPIAPRIETLEEIRDRVLEAAEYIPIEQLGTCDVCGISPFCDETMTCREPASAKIRAGVDCTELAQERLGRV